MSEDRDREDAAPRGGRRRHAAAGLPRRAPGHRLVPGAVEPVVPNERPSSRGRDPEAIRANLSRHQQGVRNGRTTVNTTTRENDEQGVR